MSGLVGGRRPWLAGRASVGGAARALGFGRIWLCGLLAQTLAEGRRKNPRDGRRVEIIASQLPGPCSRGRMEGKHRAMISLVHVCGWLF